MIESGFRQLLRGNVKVVVLGGKCHKNRGNSLLFDLENLFIISKSEYFPIILPELFIEMDSLPSIDHRQG